MNSKEDTPTLHVFNADKLNFVQILPFVLFLIVAILFLLIGLISTIIFLQFAMLFILFILIYYVWHKTSKIIITHQYIMHKTIFRKCKIYWKDVRYFGTFKAIGLTITDIDKIRDGSHLKNNYIYVTTVEKKKFNLSKPNNNTFIRFRFNKKASDLIAKQIKN